MWATARTIIEFSSQFVVGAAFHHFCDVLGFLINRHGSDDAARRWGRGQLDLDGTCLGDLTVELLQQRGVLDEDIQ